MYYKVSINSETGKKFLDLKEKGNHAIDAVGQLAKELGFKRWRQGYWCIWGGVSCVFFNSPVDKKIWTKKEDGWMPKLNTKIGKKLYAKIKDLPKVTWHDLNMCIGYDQFFHSIGVSYSNKDWVYFSVNESWNVKIPHDAIEVLYSEFKSNFNLENNPLEFHK